MQSNLFIDVQPPFQLKDPYVTHTGSIRCDAVITAAKVLTYYDNKGNELKVLRHKNEVFNDASLATLAGLPLTLSHPFEDGKYIEVTPQNDKKYRVGTVGDSIEKMNPYVKISGISITDAEALEELKQSNKQLSPGYSAQLIEESGVYDGVEYNYRQLGIGDEGIIKYNHVAIMRNNEYGRNGSDVRLLIPDSENILISNGYTPLKKDNPIIFDLKPSTKKKTMENSSRFILVDCKDSQKNPIKGVFAVDSDGCVKIPSEVFQSIVDANNAQFSMLMSAQEMSDKMTMMESQLSEMSMDSFSVLVDSYKETKAELDVLKSQPSVVTDSEDVISQKVQQRVILIDSVKAHVSEDLYKMSERQIKVALLNKFDPETSYQDSCDAEVNGAFKAAIKIMDSRIQNVTRQAETVTTAKAPEKIVVDMKTIRSNIQNSRRKA